MIARIQPSWQPEAWQEALRHAVSNRAELLRLLELSPDQLPPSLSDNTFSLRVPHSFIRRMRKADPADPLLRQILPSAAENQIMPGYLSDPVGDLAANPTPGLIHKYKSRALLIATGACAVHCRYCFRRHFPYGEQALRPDLLASAVATIATDNSLSEIILSGGDPLMLSNTRLNELTQQLSTIKHIKRLRIHSRLPIVLPERIDQGLIDWLTQLPWPTALVIHANHPHELDDDISQRLRVLAASPNITLLNQSVLLSGVNDDSKALAQLSERLFAAGVLPYYLHLLDKVSGAAHFDVAEAKAQTLHQQLREHLPGYLVPSLVREISGENSKIPVF